MSLAAREALLRASEFKTLDLELPGWGKLRIRELTAKQLIFLSKIDREQQEEAGRIYSRLAAMSLVDGDNELLFDCDNDADIDVLQDKPWSHLEALGSAILEFNGFSDKDVEARAKNSQDSRKK